jgi:gliding motility-associated-like protein
MLLIISSYVSAQVITTAAGNGTYGYSGDGGLATSSQIFDPQGVCADPAGNIYFTDHGNHVVRKISTSGFISTFAGTGSNNYSGDGGLATAAAFKLPYGICADKHGNIYISDEGAHVIRKVDVNGIVTRFAGNGIFGHSTGDGGPATQATLFSIAGISVDGLGNIYLAEFAGNVVRKINTSGIISTIAGEALSGSSGDGGPAVNARLGAPTGVDVDAAGNVYIADMGNSRIRKINTAGIITTIAGTIGQGYSGDGGLAIHAKLKYPYGVFVDAIGNVFFGDTGNNAVRKIDHSGIITTVAGTGVSGYTGDGGPATDAKLASPGDLCIGIDGSLYFNTAGSFAVRKITLEPICNSSGPLNLPGTVALCSGNTIMLNATSAYASYLWQDGSVDSIFVVTQPGNYHVSAIDGCGSTYRDSTTVIAAPPITLNVGADRTKCNTDTIHLSAPAGFISYSWSPNYNINSVSAQQVITAPTVDTAYYIKAEKSPGCFAFDTVHITVRQSPPINLGEDKSVCLGDSAVFDAAAGFESYLWSNGAITPNISGYTTGSYAVTGTTAQGCKSSDTVNIVNVYSLPVVRLNKQTNICFGESKVLQAGNFASYAWNTGSTTPSITVNAIGTYAITVTDANGCKGSDTSVIRTINPLPKSFLFADTAICSYGTLELRPALSFSRYVWSSGSIGAIIKVSQPGIYWLEATDANACKGRDSVTVYPKDCMKGFYVPNAFTPNSDGKNDLFRPLLFGTIKKYQFTIFNRWGEVVFQTYVVQNGWDGRSKALPLPSGVFVWTCTYGLEGEAVKSEKGTVVLIR